MLLAVPQSETDWDIWSVHHRQDHDLIRQAIQQQRNVNLPQYQLDPLPFNAPLIWLAYNQESHNDWNGVLRLQGHDLEGVDFRDPRQVEAWVYLNWIEHQDAANILKV